MDFDEILDDLLPTLHKVLAARLKLNRTWSNVRVETGKRNMKIVWFEPKNPTDHSKSREVKPLNVETLTQQIAIQFRKLERDQKEYLTSLK